MAVVPSFLSLMFLGTAIICAHGYSGPRGSAKSWSGREQVVVAGSNGMLGSKIFGYLQRCAPNNIFSGLGEPRGIVVSPQCAKSLNRNIGNAFVLAHASEYMMAMTNYDDEESLSRAMSGSSCAILPTRFADSGSGAYAMEGLSDLGPNANADHSGRLASLLRIACATDSMKHLVVVETPGTPKTDRTAALEACRTALASSSRGVDAPQLGVTFVVSSGAEPPADPHWTFKRGVPTTPGGCAVRVHDGLEASDLEGPLGPVTQEDLAAVIVQSIQTLPWDESRCLIVEPGTAGTSVQEPADDDPARVWVVGSSRIEGLVSKAL